MLSSCLPNEITSETLQTIAQLDSPLKLADKGDESAQVDTSIGTESSNRITSGQKKFFGVTFSESSQLSWIVSGPLDQWAKILKNVTI